MGSSFLATDRHIIFRFLESFGFYPLIISCHTNWDHLDSTGHFIIGFAARLMTESKELSSLQNNRKGAVLLITQLAPMSFQTSIPHKPWHVRCGGVHPSVVTKWPPACLHKLLPIGHQTATKENLKCKKFPTLSIFVLQIPFKSLKALNLHEFFWRFHVCPSNDTFEPK